MNIANQAFLDGYMSKIAEFVPAGPTVNTRKPGDPRPKPPAMINGEPNRKPTEEDKAAKAAPETVVGPKFQQGITPPARNSGTPAPKNPVPVTSNSYTAHTR